MVIFHCELLVHQRVTFEYQHSKLEFQTRKWQDHRWGGGQVAKKTLKKWCHAVRWNSDPKSRVSGSFGFGGPYSLASWQVWAYREEAWGLCTWVSLVPWGTPKYTHHRSYYTKCHVWRYYSNRFHTNPNKILLVDVGCASYIISIYILYPTKSHNKSHNKSVECPSEKIQKKLSPYLQQNFLHGCCWGRP